MISDMSSGFLIVKNGGLKKTSLYVHVEGLTTYSYWQNKTPWGRLDRKKAFLTRF